jgi:hypothetical protein
VEGRTIVTELVPGRVYLTEVWVMPPDLACNGTEARKLVMRFNGYTEGDPGAVHIVACGDTLLEVNENDRMENWEPADRSTYAEGTPIWKVIPIRELVPDDPDEDRRSFLGKRAPDGITLFFNHGYDR